MTAQTNHPESRMHINQQPAGRNVQQQNHLLPQRRPLIPHTEGSSAQGEGLRLRPLILHIAILLSEGRAGEKTSLLYSRRGTLAAPSPTHTVGPCGAGWPCRHRTAQHGRVCCPARRALPGQTDTGGQTATRSPAQLSRRALPAASPPRTRHSSSYPRPPRRSCSCRGSRWPRPRRRRRG